MRAVSGRPVPGMRMTHWGIQLFSVLRGGCLIRGGLLVQSVDLDLVAMFAIIQCARGVYDCLIILGAGLADAAKGSPEPRLYNDDRIDRLRVYCRLVAIFLGAVATDCQPYTVADGLRDYEEIIAERLE